MKQSLKRLCGLAAFLLALSCNLPFRESPTPGITAIPPVLVTPIPSTAPGLPTITPVAPLIPSPTLPPAIITPTQPVLLEPPGTYTETVSLTSLVNTPLDGVRRSMIYPIGGFEGFLSCDSSITSPRLEGELPLEVELGSLSFYGVMIGSCGWTRDERVTATLTYPDGSEESETLTYDPDMGISNFYSFGYGALLGRYTYTITGASGSLTHSFNVVAPRRPALLEGRDGWLYLTGFAAGERLRFVAFDNPPNSMLLLRIGWREFYADPQGNLLLQDTTNADYIVILTDGGQFFHRNDLLSAFVGDSFLPAVLPPCAGPASRLAAVAQARVVPGGGPNNVRQNPGLSSTLVGQIPAGQTATVFGTAPVCADNMLWWYVGATGGGVSGWTSEGQGSTYWLEPLE